tara:strand:+ start:209 stop:436 length:228 start_codon:yes stop_codon:yes gene_type:complete
MLSSQIISIYASIGASILSGGIILGKNFDKIQVLCQDFSQLKTEHDVWKEKVYDIHTKVCLIDQKLNTLIDQNKN